MGLVLADSHDRIRNLATNTAALWLLESGISVRRPEKKSICDSPGAVPCFRCNLVVGVLLFCSRAVCRLFRSGSDGDERGQGLVVRYRLLDKGTLNAPLGAGIGSWPPVAYCRSDGPGTGYW